mmetsp:Transcript_49040/g.57283  ORF Transcript_49040/g.57283 Transcript_49040/m.57283 type:complete len:244 (+) Transcript_49040:49-780(+)
MFVLQTKTNNIFSAGLLIVSSAMWIHAALALAIMLTASNFVPSSALSVPPTFSIIDRVRNDFLALSRRSTTRHILLPKSRDAALALKQKMRNRVVDDDKFVVDVFSSAATKFSLDTTTSGDGGLLGTMMPQGYCSVQEIDRACFEAPLGEIYGPIESDYGFHLVLVCERTNCPKLDGPNTRVARTENGRTVCDSPQDGSHKSVSDQLIEVSIFLVGFWIAVSFAGGILAEAVCSLTDKLGKLS